MRSWTLLFILGVTACGPGSAGKAVRPKAPTYGEATGAVACTGVPNLARPLAIDWRPEDRADLEVAMKQGIAVVSYDCKQARILRDCHVEGSYGFVGTTRKQQVIHLANADELKLNLPFSHGRVGGGVQRGAALDAAMDIVGEQVASRPVIAKSDLAGDCTGATHFVREATVGAFVTRQNTSGKVEAAAEILSLGASGSSTSSKEIINKRRQPGRLPHGRSVVEVAVTALRVAVASRAEGRLREAGPTRLQSIHRVRHAEHLSDRRGVRGRQVCAGKAFRSASLLYGEGRDCTQQCQRGNAPSCTRLGLMHERGEGVGKDLSKAAALYDKACAGERRASLLSARGNASRRAAGSSRTRSAPMSLLHKACMAGWSQGMHDADGLLMKKHAGDIHTARPAGGARMRWRRRRLVRDAGHALPAGARCREGRGARRILLQARVPRGEQVRMRPAGQRLRGRESASRRTRSARPSCSRWRAKPRTRRVRSAKPSSTSSATA